MDQASHAVLRMRDDVDALASTEVDPQHAAETGTFMRLADNLGALSFLIDMLSVQPQMAQARCSAYDPETGNLSAVMGRRTHRLSAFGGFDELKPSAPPPLVDQAQSLALAAAQSDVADETVQRELGRLSQQALLADQRALAETMASAQQALQRATDDEQRQAVRSELAQAVADLAAPAAAEPQAVQQPARATPAPQPEVQGSTGLEEDEEMREIFIDEAREVVQGADEALRRLGETPDDLGDLTLIRRAFHTLKGSSRMVGLKVFGEAAWACEQLYNTRLAESSRLESDLCAFTADALRELGDWVEAIADGRAQGATAPRCRRVPTRCAIARRSSAPRRRPRAAQRPGHGRAAASVSPNCPAPPTCSSTCDVPTDGVAPKRQPSRRRPARATSGSTWRGEVATWCRRACDCCRSTCRRRLGRACAEPGLLDLADLGWPALDWQSRCCREAVVPHRRAGAGRRRPAQCDDLELGRRPRRWPAMRRAEPVDAADSPTRM